MNSHAAPGRVTLSSPQGNNWVLAAGGFLGRPAVLAGPAWLNLVMSRSIGAPVSITLKADVIDPDLYQDGPLDALLWQALGRWPDDRAGRRQPAELEALLELARLHPEEYESLREKIGVIRALGG